MAPAHGHGRHAQRTVTWASARTSIVGLHNIRHALKCLDGPAGVPPNRLPVRNKAALMPLLRRSQAYYWRPLIHQTVLAFHHVRPRWSVSVSACHGEGTAANICAGPRPATGMGYIHPRGGTLIPRRMVGTAPMTQMPHRHMPTGGVSFHLSPYRASSVLLPSIYRSSPFINFWRHDGNLSQSLSHRFPVNLTCSLAPDTSIARKWSFGMCIVIMDVER
ncbi:hypothetical protein BD779DRAFT_500887 [Infundibulicybe gibba]|nr:hypothetical protein BD779DRAFT_500887 [Infundibulicybe gibba]